jgi:hypothetical protein
MPSTFILLALISLIISTDFYETQYSNCATGWTNGVQFPAEAQTFFLYHRVRTCFGSQPATCPMGTGGSFPTVKRAEREADHTPPSTTYLVKRRANFNFTALIYAGCCILLCITICRMEFYRQDAKTYQKFLSDFINFMQMSTEAGPSMRTNRSAY